MLITAIISLVAIYDELRGTHVMTMVMQYHAQWIVLGSWVGSHLGLELGIADKKAKENLAEKGRY